ncbi:MAG TPA: GNAT family N-acetyltransferase [Gemmatimonadaceae bacterium]|nr:GNAT family N-acetyltransferase [Gemmatimonadaceae bacterium]
MASAAAAVLNRARLEPVRDDESDFVVRDVRLSDNAGLVALAASCAMAGALTLRIDRAPDFLALNRLEGDRWRLAVAERNGAIVGCVAFSERAVFVNGLRTRTGYVGDLKVHPDHRDTTIADALSMWAESACNGLPPRSPVVITVLAGNRAMERRLAGPRGVPRFDKVGTIRTHSITILWKRGRLSHFGARAITTTPAAWSDLPQMAELWNRVARRRQLAPTMTAQSLAAWIRAAPGLDISSYRLARSRSGELLGFLAVWDQRAFKQLTVVAYSPRMAAARKAFNFLAPLVGATRLPPAGSPLGCATVVHLCVPGDRAQVLRALLIDAHNELRHSDFSFMNVGLDVKDPLSRALRGMFAQPMDVNAYTMAERSGAPPEVLDGRPLHYEIALV